MRLSELDFETFKKVVAGNHDLQNAVYEYEMDNANFWVSEYLRNIPSAADYSISDYGYSYIDLSKVSAEDIRDYYRELNSTYGLFDGIKYNDTLNMIDNLVTFEAKLEEDITSEEEETFEKLSGGIREIIQDRLRDILLSEYNIPEEDQIRDVWEAEALHYIDYDPDAEEVTETIIKHYK